MLSFIDSLSMLSCLSRFKVGGSLEKIAIATVKADVKKSVMTSAKY